MMRKFEVGDITLCYGSNSNITIPNIMSRIEELEAIMRTMEFANIHIDSVFELTADTMVIHVPEMTEQGCNILYSCLLQLPNVIYQLKNNRNSTYNFRNRVEQLTKLLHQKAATLTTEML